MLTGATLFAAQVVAHASFVSLIFYGKVHEWAICLAVYFFTGCVGMTATYHRLLSHKAWNCPRWIEYFGVFCASVGLTGSAIAWVAVHRKHHRFTDTANDPHSPHHKGFIYCQWLSMFEHVEIKYVGDLIKQKFYVLQHRYYFLINLVYALGVALIDPWALVYAWLAPACILWNAGSSIVTLSHTFGKNPHGLQNYARNQFLLGFLVWGEGWHNNHHANASTKKFGEHVWQIDVGYYYIWSVETGVAFFHHLQSLLRPSIKSELKP